MIFLFALADHRKMHSKRNTILPLGFYVGQALCRSLLQFFADSNGLFSHPLFPVLSLIPGWCLELLNFFAPILPLSSQKIRRFQWKQLFFLIIDSQLKWMNYWIVICPYLLCWWWRWIKCSDTHAHKRKQTTENKEKKKEKNVRMTFQLRHSALILEVRTIDGTSGRVAPNMREELSK